MRQAAITAVTIASMFFGSGNLQDRYLFRLACRMDGPLPTKPRKRREPKVSAAPVAPVEKVEVCDLLPQLAKPILSPGLVRKGRTLDTELARYDGYAVEFKFDGERWFASADGFTNRRGKPGAFPHLAEAFPPGVTVDGEIIVAADPIGSTCHEVATLRRDAPEQLGFLAFDLVEFEGEPVIHLPWTERRRMLEEIAEGMAAASGGKVMLSEVFEDPRATFERAKAMRGEGVMLKRRDAPYKPKGRSHWVKWKLSEDFDVVITDCNSESVVPGHVGLSYGFYDQGGTLRRVGGLGHTGLRVDMAPHVGQVAKVRGYGEQYPTGALRHPTLIGFRNDKCATECVFNFNNQEGSK